jgi:hypothetical protein
MALSLFNRNRNQAPAPSQADIDAAVRRRERERNRNDGEDNGDRVRDLEDQVESLVDQMEADRQRSQNSGSSSGGFLDILALFQTLNVDAASTWAIDRSTEAAKGPVDSTGTPIGGTGYDPAASSASTQTNGRILKWNVNQTVYLARAMLAFMIYFGVQLKWHILELVLGDSSAQDMAGLQDLLIFGVLLGGLGGSTAGSGTAGGLGFLGSLFQVGPNAAVMNTAPFYTTV